MHLTNAPMNVNYARKQVYNCKPVSSTGYLGEISGTGLVRVTKVAILLICVDKVIRFCCWVSKHVGRQTFVLSGSWTNICTAKQFIAKHLCCQAAGQTSVLPNSLSPNICALSTYTNICAAKIFLGRYFFLLKSCISFIMCFAFVRSEGK